MNSLRMVLNIALAIVLISGGVFLLGQDSFFLGNRWNPQAGTLFQGVALYSLASSLILAGAFAGFVARSWMEGSLSIPDPNTLRPHPSYKGAVIVRFWYGFRCIVVAGPIVSERRQASLAASRCRLSLEDAIMTNSWLTTLITETPQDGFELAIVLSRRGVKYTQPDMDVLKKLRPDYANSADSLTAASHVIAVNFQTIAAANGYWRK